MLDFERGARVVPVKTGLQRDFDRSQELRPILLWSTLVGIVASGAAPLLLSTESARELGMSRIGILGAIVLPLVACMLVGQAIYHVLVRLDRSDARVKS